jgi:hypothetical protein
VLNKNKHDRYDHHLALGRAVTPLIAWPKAHERSRFFLTRPSLRTPVAAV